jgi:hypothetical protein
MKMWKRIKLFFLGKSKVANTVAANALGLFTKATSQLEESMVLANDVISKNELTIAKLGGQNVEMRRLITSNKNVVENINKLLVGRI